MPLVFKLWEYHGSKMDIVKGSDEEPCVSSTFCQSTETLRDTQALMARLGNPSSFHQQQQQSRFNESHTEHLGVSMARLGLEGPVHSHIMVTTNPVSMPEKWVSRVRFSDATPRHLFEQSFTQTSHGSQMPTMQIYEVKGGETPVWASDLVHALTTMGYTQFPIRPRWYKTEGVTHWFKTIWPSHS